MEIAFQSKTKTVSQKKLLTKGLEVADHLLTLLYTVEPVPICILDEKQIHNTVTCTCILQ